MRADVRGGQRFSDTLSARPRDFPPIYRALIKAGEDSGDLARIMERLADYIEERNALRSKVLTAFIYPAIVGCVSICIVIFLLAYVVPAGGQRSRRRGRSCPSSPRRCWPPANTCANGAR